MGLDTWLEQDIREFLDHENVEEKDSSVVRLEDTEAMYAGHDWKKEIQLRLGQGDDEGAKQLFAQLRVKYRSTPKAHEGERASLYKMMQECYVLIANHVLEEWHTKEILQRMESDPENIFDKNVKPIDLSIPSVQLRDTLPDVPQINKATVEHIQPLATLREDDKGNDDEFDFEPQSLMKTIHTASTKAKEQLETAQKKKDEETRKPSFTSHFDKTAAVSKLREAINIALKEPEKAYKLLEPLTNANVPQDIRVPAKKLLDAIKPFMNKPAKKPVQEAQEENRDEKQQAIDAYATVAKAVDNQLVIAGSFARARNNADAREALRKAKTVIEELEKQHPEAAKPLRQRLDRTARTFRIEFVPAETGAFDKHVEPSHPHQIIIKAVHAAKLAAENRDEHAFHASLAILERASRNLHEREKLMLSDAIMALRMKAQARAI